jgi:hypothetical protein
LIRIAITFDTINAYVNLSVFSINKQLKSSTRVKILNHKDLTTTQRYLAKLLGNDYFENNDVEIDTFEF